MEVRTILLLPFLVFYFSQRPTTSDTATFHYKNKMPASFSPAFHFELLTIKLLLFARLPLAISCEDQNVGWMTGNRCSIIDVLRNIFLPVSTPVRGTT
jgi:hypothetical protein